MGSNPMTDILIRRGKFEHTHRGRDCSYVTISQGTPRTASNHQKLEEAKKGFFPRDLGGSMVLLTPDFRQLGFRTVENKFLLF